MEFPPIWMAILKILEEQPLRNIEIRIKLQEGNGGERIAARTMDNILRKMRISGQIEFHSGKWHSRRFVRCERCDGRGYHAPDANVSE